ncbi:Carboxypeptidase A4 [Entophlyctis luteolus]|nr:Carboxypeptidase A4 [Entophlyctis luteolus]
MLSPHAASPDLAAIYAALNDAAAAELVSVPLRFEGHQVWRVAIRSQTDLDRIFTLQEQVPTLDYWTDPRIDSHGVDIRVSSAKGAQDALSDYLNSNRNPPVENSHGQQSFLTDTADPIKSYFTKYHPTSEINSYLSYLATTYPDIVEMFSIGETYEGRNQWGVKIRSPKTHLGAQKKEFVFFGGHHAREWIGPAVVQYIMTELIVKYGQNEEITTALDDFDFTIIPVLNVDGYEYTHTTNRMWRKNRQPNHSNTCVGTDPNRNWDTNWGGDGTSSKNPCSDSFIGTAPFSAPEPRNIAAYISSRAPNIVSVIDFHAYSQLWMFPYGSYCDVFADVHVEEGAKKAAAALKKVHGKSFAVGSICNIIYQASGSSVDWTYDHANVTFSYGVELRDQGLYGFLLPPKQIVLSGEETFAAVLALVQYIRKYLGGVGAF